MTTMRYPSILMATLAIGVATSASNSIALASDGLDWPHWRGPDRTGISSETDWSSTASPEPLWRAELGFGHSSFAISNGRLYTLGYDAEAGEDVVYCLDPETGEQLWTHRYAADIWNNAHDGGTLTTPTVDGDVVYTSNREGKLFCLDASTGAVHWSRDLVGELEIQPPTWGFSGSPLVVGDVIYMNLGRLAAIDKKTGKDLWITETHYGNAYSTPAPFTHEGRDCLALFNGNGLAILDRGNGAEIAFHEWVKRPQIYPMTPIVTGDRIFVSAGYERGCAMLRFTGAGLEPLWESRAMRNKMTGSVLHEDHLYGFDESILKCIDLDGNEQWRQRGLGAGALMLAGDRLVILDAKGEVVIAEANPKQYTELYRRKELTGGGSFWTIPVLSHGLLYVRSGKGETACLDFRSTANVADASTATGTGELPDAESLFARHVESSGGANALNRVTSLKFSGTNEELFNIVDQGTTELIWDARQGIRWTTSTDAGFDYGCAGDRGWSIGVTDEPQMLEGAELEVIAAVGDLRRFLAPDSGYASLETARLTTFDNRSCYAVAATSKGGHARTLYFDAESGFYAGHEGEGIPMLTFADYRNVEGCMVPMTWSYFDSTIGAMNVASFNEVELNPTLLPDAFAPPRAIVLMSRTPDQVEADTARLRKAHEALFGKWKIIDESEEAPPVEEFAVLDAKDGYLTLEWPGMDVDVLFEPDETDRLVLVNYPYVHLRLKRDAEGQVTELQIFVNDRPRERLTRTADR